MKDKKIALLIDVDNVKISSEAFADLYAELKERGEVVYSKFYGYNDRKHIYLADIISNYGYDTAPFMRFKKRFSQLDNRILVDAVKLNYSKPEINTFCIVAGEGDLIPLYVELKSSGKSLIDLNTEYQEINGHLVDEHIVLKSISKEAEVYTSKMSRIADKVKEQPKKVPVKKAAAEKVVKVKEVVVEPVVVEDKPQEIDADLAKKLRAITTRYGQLDFSSDKQMAEKAKLVKDIEALVLLENTKGEGVYSSNPDVRQIFSDLVEAADDIKKTL